MNEPRQRWRLVFARGDAALYLSHLDIAKLWERAFRRAGIPVALSGGFNARPRLIFAAPLPLGTLAEGEIADIYLSERLTLADLRARLQRDLPNGFTLVDLHDVWINAPAVAARLAAADYRLEVTGVSLEALAGACARLLALPALEREKRREKKVTTYDLRPLVLALACEPAPLGEGSLLRMRLRHAQEGGSGRPEEVVAALADLAGEEPVIASIVRERLLLADEADAAPQAADAARQPATGARDATPATRSTDDSALNG